MSGAPDDKHRRIAEYSAAYESDEGFESALVDARHRLAAEMIDRLLPGAVVEVGCGTELLIDRVAASTGLKGIGAWIIIEPTSHWAERAQEGTARHGCLSVVQGFVEDEVDQVADRLGGSAPLVVCASMLHEVPDHAAVLDALRRLVDGGGLVHINVPNAGSLHRRLAVSMGLIETVDELSERNLWLQQQRVFDRASLYAEAVAHGFEVLESGGCFVKPFTHGQMEQIPFVDQRMIDGLYRLGRELPDIAAEIYVNVRAAP